MRKGQIQSPEVWNFLQVDSHDLIPTLWIRNCLTCAESALTMTSPSMLWKTSWNARPNLGKSVHSHPVIPQGIKCKSFVNIAYVRKILPQFLSYLETWDPLILRFYWSPSNIFLAINSLDWLSSWSATGIQYFCSFVSMAEGN